MEFFFFQQTGLLAGSPHILGMFFSWIYAALSDWLLLTKRLTITNVRKMATCCCTALPAIMMIGLSLSGCHPIMAITFNMIGVTVMGAVSSGPLATLVDLSPNYAGVLLGICGLVVDAAGFLSPLVVGLLINNNVRVNKIIIYFRFFELLLEKVIFIPANANTVALGLHHHSTQHGNRLYILLFMGNS